VAALQYGAEAEGHGWVADEPLSPLQAAQLPDAQTGVVPVQAETLAAVHCTQRLVPMSQRPLAQSTSTPTQPPGAAWPFGASGRQPLGLPDPAQ
jgi:hypothetical protein